MKKLVVFLSVLAAMFGMGARAQATDLSGNWQGTLHAKQDLRVILSIFKGDKDGWSAKMYSIDQTSQAIPVDSVKTDGSNITIAVNLIGGNFEGKLSGDGKTITGTWSQGAQPMPLILVKATPETAWEIPAPPPPPKELPADADPSFAVATIKPNPSGANSMQGLNTNGHDFRVRNGSLADLIEFAYDVQLKQIVNGPDWMDQDRYDIDAKQDQDGLASEKQLRGMVRKLLDDRFAIKVHQDKRDMPAFVLSVGAGGEKLTASSTKGPLPGMGFRPVASGVMMIIRNGTTDELAEFMQSSLLDRPVVNRTAITGRYDITMTFTPDDSQFKGHPPKLPAAAAGADPQSVEAAPSLFDAIQKQLGLKLSSEKTPVDVVVIDHVTKPSPN